MVSTDNARITIVASVQAVKATATGLDPGGEFTRFHPADRDHIQYSLFTICTTSISGHEGVSSSQRSPTEPPIPCVAE